jgi:competence protein ComEC
VALRIAIVNDGAGNTYGHPGKTTRDTLVAVGALVRRTDGDGDTAVVQQEQGLSVVRRGRPRGPPH